jgi:hypothetical protein
MKILILLLLLLQSTANAGGPRNPAGLTYIPATGKIRQFDSKKIEVIYQRWTLVFDRSFSGLPVNLEPRPENPIEIKLTMSDWHQVIDKTRQQPDRIPIDLRGILK